MQDSAMNPNVYDRAPLRMAGEIPCFSSPSEYTNNYERISQDHIREFRATGKNPWIPEGLWVQTEESTLEQVRRYSKPGDSILDVGVGMGRLLSPLSGWKRYGMDISLGYLEMAREKGVEVCYSLIEDMPYRQNSFDCVVCTDVLEHVVDLHLCCSKVLSVLRPKGHLVVRVPYREDMTQYLRADLPYRYIHLRNFDEYTLRLLFGGIFRCEFCEMALAGVSTGRFRFPVPGRLSRRVVAKLVSTLARVWPSAHWQVSRIVYAPYAMTMTFAKP